MIFLIDTIKSLIFLTFPIFVYLFFENLNYKKDMTLSLKISLFSSCFLYAIFTNNIYLSIFINIPLVIAYLKNNQGTYFLINLAIIAYLFLKIDISIYLIILEYTLLYIFLNLGKLKFNTFIIISTYFYSFTLFFYKRIDFLSFETLKILFLISLYYIVALSIKYMTTTYKNKYRELEEKYRSYLFKFIHEVKNPIAVCKGYIEIINNSPKKDSKKYLKIIDKEIDESLNIMEEYLVFGRFKVNLDYMDVSLLLEDVYNNFIFLTKEKGITLNLHYDEEDVIILGDYNKLKQVLTNIIKNSIEARKIDEQLIININLKCDNNNVLVKIEDNGIGIEELDKIGDKFYTTKVSGTGLGINFSKTIISLHNGKIKYESSEKGTNVFITMPLVEM